MASTTYTRTEGMPTEMGLLDSLVKLYDRELILYGDILELSRKQTLYIKDNKPLADIHDLLRQKAQILDSITRLEAMHGQAKVLWNRKKQVLVGEIPANLQNRFTRISDMIEEIMKVEASNDQLLFAAAARA